MILSHVRFKRDDVGKIGVDASGRRFVVLQPSNMIAGSDACDDPNYVATLPGGSMDAPAGVVIHAAHLKLPVQWERGLMVEVPGSLRALQISEPK